MEGVVTHDFRFRLEEPTKKENQQVTVVKARTNSLLRKNLSVELKKLDFYFNICH